MVLEMVLIKVEVSKVAGSRIQCSEKQLAIFHVEWPPKTGGNHTGGDGTTAGVSVQGRIGYWNDHEREHSFGSSQKPPYQMQQPSRPWGMYYCQTMTLIMHVQWGLRSQIFSSDLQLYHLL